MHVHTVQHILEENREKQTDTHTIQNLYIYDIHTPTIIMYSLQYQLVSGVPMSPTDEYG